MGYIGKRKRREMQSIYGHDFCTLDVSLSWGFRVVSKHGSFSAPSIRVGVGLVGRNPGLAQSDGCFIF